MRLGCNGRAPVRSRLYHETHKAGTQSERLALSRREAWRQEDGLAVHHQAGITMATVGLTWRWFRPTVTTTCKERDTDTCAARRRSGCSGPLQRFVMSRHLAKEPAVFHPVVQRIVSPADQQNHMVTL